MGRFDELQRLFLEAQELEGAERQRFVASVADESMRSQLAGLLNASAEADRGGFLELGTVVPDRSPPKPGDRFGNYEILREVRAGGMGIVFHGHDVANNREVAIKFLHPLLWADKLAREQLLHEARIVARLDHPGIVRLFESLEVDDWLMLVYEYVGGGPLTDEIERYHRQGGAGRWNQPADAVGELLPVVEGLVHAHEQGIWHRDIKPSNILLGVSGPARITDFGLAKDSADGDLTRSGIYKGSIRYMSPEQARARLRLVDARSDVYSFGLVLYECLAGVHAFAGGADHEVLERIAHDEAPWLHTVWPEAPESLTAVCYKALRRDPDQRYATMREVGDDLRAAMQARPVSARLPSRGELALARLRHRRARFAIGVMAAAIVALGVFLVRAEFIEPTTRVRVDSTGPGHDVTVQSFDPETGKYSSARSLGRTPVKTALPQGFYRITVATPSGEFAELYREIHPDSESVEQLEVEARPTATTTDDMILIPAGTFLAGYTGNPSDPFNPPHTAEILRSYWIDRTEVTNAEYARFVHETGHPAPSYFEGVHLETIANLPVASVSWEDALAYAEWAGKRLPTEAEWERAARGTDGRVTAWGTEPEDLTKLRELACMGRNDAETWGTDFDGKYRACACPVSSFPSDISPDGLFDVTGSVSEWVEDRPTGWNDGVLSLKHGDRLAKGASWQLPLVGVHLGSVMAIPEDTRNYGVGFRCARSAVPVTKREEADTR